MRLVSPLQVTQGSFLRSVYDGSVVFKRRLGQLIIRSIESERLDAQCTDNIVPLPIALSTCNCRNSSVSIPFHMYLELEIYELEYEQNLNMVSRDMHAHIQTSRGGRRRAKK